MREANTGVGSLTDHLREQWGRTQRGSRLALVLRELNQSRLFILSCHSVVCLKKKKKSLVLYLIISEYLTKLRLI